MAKFEFDVHIVPKEAFKIGSFSVTETMLSAFIASIVLIIFALIVRFAFIPSWSKNDRKKSCFRILMENLINLFDGNAKEQVGSSNSGFMGSFYFSACALITVSTLLELFNFRPPLSDLNLTLIFGVITFAFVVIMGIKKKKARRLLHYINPFYLITDIVVPFSIALRMFGSVFSGYLIMELLYSQVFLSIAIPALASVLFTVFHAIIQSYIYMFLSLSLMNEAME